MTEPVEPIPRVLRQLVILRRQAGLSQASLAEAIDTVQSAISELESGTVAPTLTTLRRYAQYFGMEIVVTVGGAAVDALSDAGTDQTEGDCG